MTAQEMFNKVAVHLMTQGTASRDDLGQCLYRGPNNTRCAIGCLIPDKNYDPRMEGAAVASLLHGGYEHSSFPTIVKLIGNNVSLANSLQRIHDTKEPDEWLQALEECAATFELNTDVLYP